MPCRQLDRLGGRVSYDAAVGRERPGDDAASVWKIEKNIQPRFLSHMRKKAPLTVERKNSQGGVSILPLDNPP